MAWREFVQRRFGPGLLTGITIGDWIRLLRQPGSSVAPSCLPRALHISAQSVQNSVLGAYESRRYGTLLTGVDPEPPLFVIGHWRSGTTLLHRLLAADRRFAFPNTFQVAFPHTFLTTESRYSRLIGFFFPPHRSMDKVRRDLSSPQEDEFALCVSSQHSPYMSWALPRRREHFERFLTFRDATPRELDRWGRALDVFLKKLTWKYRRPLVLKSPAHTGRIRLLLARFPEARFVHIHRDPLTVFQSSRLAFRLNLERDRLQSPRLDDLDAWILRQYRELYQAFFDERSQISTGRLCEVRYDQLEREPIETVRRIYDALAIPGFQRVEPALEAYVASLRGYEKNRFEPLSMAERAVVARQWARTFEEWGYQS